jgi:hypothetical protein
MGVPSAPIAARGGPLRRLLGFQIASIAMLLTHGALAQGEPPPLPAAPAPSAPADPAPPGTPPAAATEPPAPSNPTAAQPAPPSAGAFPAPPGTPPTTMPAAGARTAEWGAGYEHARAQLTAGAFSDAATRFEELERTATNPTDRALAHDQRALALDWWTRGLTLVKRSAAGEGSHVDLRTTDELVSLYTSGVFHGIGTGVWVAVLAKPGSTAGNVLPALGFAGLNVAAIVGLDSGGGMKYGVPQSIVSGLNIGLEHGIAWTIYGNAATDGEWSGGTNATVIWGASTAGAVAGGLIGHFAGSTPGRSSFVGSSALWTGLVLGFGSAAVLPEDDAKHAVAVGAAGLSIGTIGGALLAGSVSPTIARVRFIDLGGIAGGLLAGGLYAAAANNGGSGQAAAGVTTLGIGGGLVVGWLLTSGMEDRPAFRSDEPPKPEAVRMRPMISPTKNGGVVGVGGVW